MRFTIGDGRNTVSLERSLRLDAHIRVIVPCDSTDGEVYSLLSREEVRELVDALDMLVPAEPAKPARKRVNR